MKQLLNAVKQAAQDTAHFMQREIRQSAREHGWDEDVVSNTHIKYHDNKFHVIIPDEHAAQAFVHEYGNEESRPTAVLRKYENHNKAGSAFVKSLNSQLKGKL